MICFQRVKKKAGGDYAFEGTIQAIFHKRSGQTRIVVENDDGLLFIMNATQVEFVPDNPATKLPWWHWRRWAR